MPSPKWLTNERAEKMIWVHYNLALRDRVENLSYMEKEVSNSMFWPELSPTHRTRWIFVPWRQRMSTENIK